MARKIHGSKKAFRTGGVATMLIVWLSSASPSYGEDSSPRHLAQIHQDRGTIYFNLGEFEQAVIEYRKGYEQTADPVFLFNIATAYDELGADEKALFFFKRYLSTAKEVPNRASIERQIADLEGIVARSSAGETPRQHAFGLRPMPLESSRTSTPDSMSLAPQPDKHARPRPLWHHWWFWAGAGALVLGGVATGIVLSMGGSNSVSTELGAKRFF